MNQFLEHSKYIDWQTPEVLALAAKLAEEGRDEKEVAQACFEWVRDEIKHSVDFKLNPVTCKASEVLKHGTGYCYAKSHLLAALLRANGIPAALCYQRLSVGDGEAPYCLHGLNALYLKDYGWYRVDARGNKAGVDAQFCPPEEKLAFHLADENEFDVPGRFSEPLPEVVDVLESYFTYNEVLSNLPDIRSVDRLDN